MQPQETAAAVTVTLSDRGKGRPTVSVDQRGPQLARQLLTSLKHSCSSFQAAGAVPLAPMIRPAAPQPQAPAGTS